MDEEYVPALHDLEVYLNMLCIFSERIAARHGYQTTSELFRAVADAASEVADEILEREFAL